MNDFEKLVEEVAKKCAPKLANIKGTRVDYLDGVFIDYAKRVVSELQKRQEAVVTTIYYEDGLFALDRKDWCKLNELKPGTQLFRFPPSCEDKVKELEEERDQLREQLEYLESELSSGE